MGHTLATVTQQHQQFLSYVKPFRRVLRKSDQLALDRLLEQCNQHLPAAAYAPNLLPGIAFLLALVLEKHKEIERQATEFELYRRDLMEELRRSEVKTNLELGKLRTEIFLLQKKPKTP